MPKEEESFQVSENDAMEMVPGVWDANCNYEQMEAFNYAVKSSCELGFEKVCVYI